jgi:hypothetical protein
VRHQTAAVPEEAVVEIEDEHRTCLTLTLTLTLFLFQQPQSRCLIRQLIHRRGTGMPFEESFWYVCFSCLSAHGHGHGKFI